MSILSNNALLFLGADQAAGDQISRSLRFNSSDSAYLSQGTSRSPAANTSISFSFWLKLANLATDQQIIWSNPAAGYLYIVYWGNNYNGALYVGNDAGGLDVNAAKSNGVLRDPSAWYHILYSRAHGSNGILYINGVQQTAQAINTANVDFFADSTRSIGRRSNGTRYGNYYLADFHCIDGQALTPSSFTEVSATTGQLIPKAYTGTYGTNGFHLPFSNNSTAAALGTDTSGNSNTWTVNNISVTAGAGNDSLVDTPTSYGTDTGAGGEVRGNYATLNPLDKANIGSAVLSNGNLDYNSTSGGNRAPSTIGVSSGKWYMEMTANTSGNASWTVGVIDCATGSIAVSYYAFDGKIYPAGTAYGNTYTAGDVIGVALDLDNGKIFFSKNGTWQNSGNPVTGANPAASSLSGTYAFFVGHGSSTSTSTSTANFGQRPFAYTAPSGFKALCDTNLPAPVVAQPSTVMDVKLYTGNGSTQTISGLGFSPDLVWIKERNAAADHALYDTVRGVQQQLESNTTTDETTESTGLTAFNSDGFALSSLAQVNTNTDTYVAWCWDESATAGFDIVTYTGNGSARTISHGLGVAPNMIIVKARTTASTDQGWAVYHSANTANPETDYLLLNSTAATADLDTVWNDTAPTSSVFSVGTNALVNVNNDTYVAYLFSAVVGYSSFGSYTGNGDTSGNGPFVFTGHLSRWLMIKRTDTTGDWILFDTARDTYNQSGRGLRPNLSDAEYDDSTGIGIAYTSFDFLSNGFKVRGASGRINASGGTYVYASFAQNPFQYARAR